MRSALSAQREKKTPPTSAVHTHLAGFRAKITKLVDLAKILYCFISIVTLRNPKSLRGGW